MGNSCKKIENYKELSDKEIRLVQINTKLSMLEILEWHEKFMKEYPTGYIDEKDFRTIMKQAYPNGNCDKYAKFLFKGFDRDRNHKITLHEFLLATSFILNQSNENNFKLVLDLAFDIYDVNNNGKIDKKEMKKILAAFYECQGETQVDANRRVDQIFNEFDADHNQYLDKNEFKRFFVSNNSTAILGF